MKPIQWLEDATPEEIGEAILAVSEAKAVEVIVYLVPRIGSEFDSVMKRITERFGKDPMKSILGLLQKPGGF